MSRRALAAFLAGLLLAAAGLVLLRSPDAAGPGRDDTRAARPPPPPGSPTPTSLAARPVPGASGTTFEPWPEGTDAAASGEDFVGAATCSECHEAQYDAWRGSTHGTAGAQRPSASDVVAPFDGTPMRFADATVVPRRSPEGGYEFLVRRPGRPDERLTVDAVVGKGHMVGGGTQGALEHREDGTWRLLPFDYSVTAGRWFCNVGDRREGGWVPVGPDLELTSCLDWTPRRVLGTVSRYTNCQQCHGSQIRVDVRRGPPHFDTRFTSLAVNCESCHGPGRRHVERARAGEIPGREDIGIASLAGMDRDASLGVCFQCHAVKDALAGNHLPGRRLTDHFSLLSPQLGESPHHADGRVRSFGYQLNHLGSGCYLEGGMTCVDCHAPHGQDYRDVWKGELPDRFADGQCLGCHAAKAERPERHTHHPPDSDGSRCVACHMPYLQPAEVGADIPYGRSDHTIPVPRPAADSALGVEPACRECHRDRSVAQLQADVARWWGRPKPRRPAVRGLLAPDGLDGGQAPGAAARDLETASRTTGGAGGDAGPERLLHAEAGDPMARYAGLARLYERRLVPDSAPGPDVQDDLERMARTGDLDLRALALAALDLTLGGDSAAHARLEAMAGEDPGLRERIEARWGQALGWTADRYRARGRYGVAETVYRRALRVTPDDPDLHVGLGYAHSSAGNPSAALVAYRAARDLRPDDALLMVNTGLALRQLGRTEEATAAYREATEIDPSEPLAHFNLGNAHLRAGDHAAAVREYRRTIALDESLAPAHFNLARALLARESYRPALRALRAGLAYDSANAEARDLARRLEEALEGR